MPPVIQMPDEIQTLQVIEEFVSVNGEGLQSGALAYFIRLNGCNLRCQWCDTAWSQKEAPYLEETPQNLIERVKASGVHCVTITGGEPLLQPQGTLFVLIDGLLALPNCRVEIETNGSVSLKSLQETFAAFPNLSLTVDYKLPSSGQTQQMDLENFKGLRSTDTVKFVMSDLNDLEVAIDFAKDIQRMSQGDAPWLAPQILFSPCYNTLDPQIIVARLIEEKLNGVRIQMQLHKLIWHPDMRGV